MSQIRPIIKSAAELGAGLKNIARSIGGAILIAAIGLSWASGANAYLITQKPFPDDLSGGEPGGLPVFDVSGLVAGDSFGLTWDFPDAYPNGVPGVYLTGIVTLDALTASSATIGVWINNLSSDTGGGNPRATVFGLSISSPSFAGYSSIDELSSSAGSSLTEWDGTGGFSGFGDVVACATAASCTTGKGGGIVAGDSDHFIMVVSGIFGPTLTLDSFALKIQGGPLVDPLDPDSNDSYQLPGTPSAVPLPAALPLFLSALAGLGLIGWRRNRAAA